MEIAVLAIGRLKSGPEAELCARYLDRARKTGRGLGFRGFDVQELTESRAARPPDRVEQEQAALFSALKDDRFICLDPGGELLDSEEFAASLSRDAGRAVPRLTFVIGGPDGLGDKVVERAAGRLSFGRVTWPHQIVRVLLAEQFYRATTILSGHPYHRA